MEKLLIEIPPASSPTSNHPKISMLTFFGEIVLVVTIFFMFSILIGSTGRFLFKNRRNVFNFKSYKKAPCHQCDTCHYFEQNPYLKCAIHPITVLTEEANDCTDYASCQKPTRF